MIGTNDYMPYKVGALLYTPANNTEIAERIINEKFSKPYSISFCLEDSISDFDVNRAEGILLSTIKKIYCKYTENKFYMPNIFVRVRRAEQVERLYNLFEKSADIITGFIFPKFSTNNAKNYINSIININKNSNKTVYMMPIIESFDVFDLRYRYNRLYSIKDKIDSVNNYVLNVRVGANDFCKNLGVRHNVYETIYEISAINSVLGDIATCFSADYVVSGPVWEYFLGNDNLWIEGLEKEIRLDRINGFIGKTLIHPSQIPIANEAFKVDNNDYNDALNVIDMKNNSQLLVGRSKTSNRMNEYKTHNLWAQKTLILAEIYGVKN